MTVSLGVWMLIVGIYPQDKPASNLIVYSS